MPFSIRNGETIDASVLALFASTPEEQRRFEEEIIQRNKRLRQGAKLCDKINQLLDQRGGLKFKSDINRLYFDKTFSFETLKRRNRENKDLLDVLIRIESREIEQTKDDDVSPSLLCAVVTLEIGDNLKKELNLDASGEAWLEGIEPGVLCRFTSLTSTFVETDRGEVITTKKHFAHLTKSQATVLTASTALLFVSAVSYYEFLRSDVCLDSCCLVECTDLNETTCENILETDLNKKNENSSNVIVYASGHGSPSLTKNSQDVEPLTYKNSGGTRSASVPNDEDANLPVVKSWDSDETKEKGDEALFADADDFELAQIPFSQWFDDFEAGTRKTLTYCGVEFTFRYCPAGTFMAGSPVNESERYDDETRRKVKIDEEFWISETETTQEQWDVVGVKAKEERRFKGTRLPIEKVSRDECVAFVERLNSLGVAPSGCRFELPTEEQWEYACRAGTSDSKSFFPLDDYAWYKDNSEDSPREVGTKKPNAWGIYDMLGNVWE